MIDYKNDYINLVVLGNFNPSILTHDFLVNECGFNLGNKPISTSPPMPVVASLDYDKISFFADLGRLQITEKNCKEPKLSQIPIYLNTYLQQLPYTPITKCGANFSYDLTVEKRPLENIEQWLENNRNKFCKTLKLKTLDLEVCFAIDDKQEEVKNWTLRTKIPEYEASTMLKVSYIAGAGNEIKIDFNYEVTGLDRDKKLLANVTTDYENVVDLFKYQVEKIFSGQTS
ncbi:hypothetical protein ES703_99605 [subsurface metagenome]